MRTELLPCLPGYALCDFCQVQMPRHPSHLCGHCQAHCMCCECFNEFAWEDLRFGVCVNCYPAKRFPYHLVKKERVCHTNSR